MSDRDRICQFYLRGRCQRQNCEFRHVRHDGAPETTRSSISLGPGVCRFFLKGNCRFGSNCRFQHERPEPERPDRIHAPVPTVTEITPSLDEPEKGASETVPENNEPAITEKAGSKDEDPVQEVVSEKVVEKAADVVKAPEKAPDTATTAQVIETAEKVCFIKIDRFFRCLKCSLFQSAPAVEETAKESSTITTAAVEATTSKLSTDLAKNVSTQEKEARKEKQEKDIRRDSKGFEVFDDYFDDSVDVTNNTTTAASEAVETPPASNVDAPAAAPEPPQEQQEQPEEKQQQQPPAFTSVPAPTETMPEEILEGAQANKEKSTAAVTTAAASSSPETPAPIRMPPKKDEARKSQVEAAKDNKKSSLADLSKEWGDDGDAASESTATTAESAPAEKEPAAQDQPGQQTQDPQETIEDIENFIESSAGEKSKKPDEATEAAAGKKNGGKKEEWVTTVVFGEDGKQIDPNEKKEKSVYDLDDEDFSATEATPFTTRAMSARGRGRPSGIIGVKKAAGMTKIGNNTYFYTGPKEGQEAAGGDTEEDEEEEDGGETGGAITGGYEGEEYDDQEDLDPIDTTSATSANASTTSSAPDKDGRRKSGKGYAQGRKQHNTNYVYGARSTAAKTRRCGECEGCNREDCGKCPSCQDKPKFGGRGMKKQACIYRICTWKNPSGKRITPQTPNLSETKKGVPAGTIVSPAAARRGRKPNETLMEPPAVTSTPKPPSSNSNDNNDVSTRSSKRGRKSISVVSPASVSGEKDSGLSGKYWSDLPADGSRRRSTRSSAAHEEPAAAGKRPAEDLASPPPASPAKRGRKPKNQQQQHKEDEEQAPEPEPEAATPPSNTPKSRGRGRPPKRRIAEEEEAEAPASKRAAVEAATARLTNSSEEDEDEQEQSELRRITDKDGTPAVENGLGNRNVSCITDADDGDAGSTEREVVVECFAPYDDHRWVNIGKSREGMAPSAVQYARALRPPYHLLSFLRIQGHSTKGMSCTDKNTMVRIEQSILS